MLIRAVFQRVNEKQILKAERVLWDSRGRLRVLLTVAASFFVNQVWNILCKDSNPDEMGKDLEFGVSENGTEGERLDNSSRSPMVAPRYPGNRYYYVAILSATFKEFIRSCRRYISNCYILQSDSPNSPFDLYQTTGIWNLVVDSHVEIDSKNVNFVSDLLSYFINIDVCLKKCTLRTKQKVSRPLNEKWKIIIHFLVGEPTGI